MPRLATERELIARYCPVHEFETRRCGLECFDQRERFRASAHELRMYWYEIRHGKRPQRVRDQ